jgi:hypothetical protein
MSNKAKERWKRLEALGAKSEIPTPEGEAKMSAVITQLAEPLLKQHGTNAQRAETIVSLTVAAWNKSMFPSDKQPFIEKELIDCIILKDGNAEDIGIAIDVMDMIAERREELFPNLRKVIVDYEVDISGGRLNLNVTSAPVPDID